MGVYAYNSSTLGGRWRKIKFEPSGGHSGKVSKLKQISEAEDVMQCKGLRFTCQDQRERKGGREERKEGGTAGERDWGEATGS